jgi:pimeloyl-ACP methyl ester carboxylesterase
VSDAPPAVLLVHGAWHGAWCWERLLPLLSERGIDARTVDLPCVGTDTATLADLHGSAAVVAEAIDRCPGEVVICAHSFGGMVATEAAAGRPRVRHLVYVAAVVPEAGESLSSIVGRGGGLAPWQRAEANGAVSVDPAQAAGVFYADCEPEAAAAATRRLRPQAGTSFAQAAVAVAWREVPSTYVVCSRDACVPVPLQRRMAERGGRVVELDTGHSPFLSRPEAVADLLARVLASVTASGA